MDRRSADAKTLQLLSEVRQQRQLVQEMKDTETRSVCVRVCVCVCVCMCITTRHGASTCACKHFST